MVRWRDAFPECERPQDISGILQEYQEKYYPQAKRVEVQVIEGAHVAPEADAPSFLRAGLGLLEQLDDSVLIEKRRAYAMRDQEHLTMEELEAGLDNIRRSPKDNGELEMIVRRPRRTSARSWRWANLTWMEGLKGDNWRARGSSMTPTARLTQIHSST